MPTWANVLIACLLGMLLLGAGLVALVVTLWRAEGPALVAKAQDTINAGRHYGAGKVDRDCMAEGFRRLGRSSGFKAQLATNVFVSGCLMTARRTPGFCEGVPPEEAIMRSVTWRREVCMTHPKLDLQACQRMLDPQQQVCATPRRAVPGSAASPKPIKPAAPSQAGARPAVKADGGAAAPGTAAP